MTGVPHELNDQDYCFLKDGRILAVHGKQSDPNLVFGEIAYVPTPQGIRRLNGIHYEKPYYYDSSTSRLDPSGHQRDATSLTHYSFSFPLQSAVRRSRIVRHVESVTRLQQLRYNPPYNLSQIVDWLETNILGNAAVTIGVTGSIAIFDDVRDTAPHDYDLVIRAHSTDIKRFLHRLHQRYARHPQARVSEYGRDWIVRTRSPYGIACLFFSATDQPELPHLSHLKETNVVVEGRVVSDKFAATTPSLMKLCTDIGSDGLWIISFDLRIRGDFSTGDKIRAMGDLAVMTSACEGQITVLYSRMLERI